MTPCFDDVIFNREICSKGFKYNLWGSLNKLTADHDVILAYLFANNMMENYLLSEIKKIDFIENKGDDSSIEWHGPPASFVEVKLSCIKSGFYKSDKLSEVQLLQKLAYAHKMDLTNVYKTIGEIKSRKGAKPRTLNQLIFDFVF